MPTYAIGDVQGCYAALRRLLDKIDFGPERDRLWFVGDLVNRGPQSLETLRFIRGLGDRAICVLGNHDLHLLALAQGGRGGRRDTLEPVLSAPDRDELLDWLRHRPLLHQSEGWLMSHAGIPAQWSLEQARTAAHEVEQALRGADHAQFLDAMYGDDALPPTSTKDHAARLRFAVNGLTRMRYYTAEGALDFSSKGPPAQHPELTPWFLRRRRRRLDLDIVFGHWSTLGQVHWPQQHVWGLDTGAVWGGMLTALNLDSRTLTQVECPENRRAGQHGGD